MRVFIATFCFISAMSWAQTNRTRLFSENTRQDILNALDDLCADTWCEGDFNYSFDHLSCDAVSGECLYEYTTIWYDFSEHKETVIEYPHSCTIKNIHHAKEVGSAGTQGWNLNEDFVIKVDACMEHGYQDHKKYLESEGLWYK